MIKYDYECRHCGERIYGKGDSVAAAIVDARENLDVHLASKHPELQADEESDG